MNPVPTSTPGMTPPANINDIYKQQGWNDPAAIAADINAGGWKTKIPSTSGGTTTSNATLGLGQPPTIDLNAITQSAFNTPEILAANKAVTDRQAALAKASGEINDNPFYSEATRVGKQAKLTEQANKDIMVQQELLTRLKADAQIKVNAAQGQYNIQNDAYKQTLSTFSNLVSAGGLTNASATDLANYSVATGIPVSMLTSIQKTQQNKNTETQLFTSDNGTISAVDKNTGKVIGSSNPGVGPSKKVTGTGGSSDKPPAKATVVNSAGQAAKAGKTYQDMLAFFVQYGLTPKEIYNIYTATNYYQRPPDNVDPKTGLYLNQDK